VRGNLGGAAPHFQDHSQSVATWRRPLDETDSRLCSAVFGLASRRQVLSLLTETVGQTEGDGMDYLRYRAKEATRSARAAEKAASGGTIARAVEDTLAVLAGEVPDLLTTGLATKALYPHLSEKTLYLLAWWGGSAGRCLRPTQLCYVLRRLASLPGGALCIKSEGLGKKPKTWRISFRD